MAQPFVVDAPVIRRLFTLLYGHEPEDAEIVEMEKFGIQHSDSERQLLRRIIACTDRQRLGTEFSIRFSKNDLRIASCEGFSLFFDETDVAVGRTIGAGHPYEINLANFLRRVLQPGMTFVDIGANIGFFTLLGARRVGESGKVIAVEPNSENCRLIMLSLRHNHMTNVKLLSLALGAQTGTAFFTPAMGSNGTLQPEAEDSLLCPNCTIVPLAPLDTLVREHVDVIKMDAEGAEGNILKGAVDLIATSRPIIVSEFSPAMIATNSKMSATDFLDFFWSRNYAIRSLQRDDATGTYSKITDIANFVAAYGSPFKIEDLAFIPRERLGADGAMPD
jgi:FkbM family methyltransferase